MCVFVCVCVCVCACVRLCVCESEGERERLRMCVHTCVRAGVRTCIHRTQSTLSTILFSITVDKYNRQSDPLVNGCKACTQSTRGLAEEPAWE